MVILGLLIGLVAPAALRQLGGARVSIAHQSIERLASVLDLYKLDVGSYPTTEQGLQALVERPADLTTWNGPYLKDQKTPMDPWSHPFVYNSPSTRNGHDYDLCSHGPSDTAAQQDMICNQ
jgi:general secretion pathway protein G